MKHSKTLLLLAPVFFLFPTLFAQTPVSLELQRQRERVPFEIAPGENRIQLCGLIPGTTYSMVAVPAIPGLKIPLRLSLADPALDAPARRMSRADRPQHRLFVATAACMDFVLQAEFPSWSGTEPGFLSVGCTDCPEASVFLEKFMQQLEQLGMANLTISPGGTATTLVTNTLIGGNCFDVSNPTSTGPTNSRGTFANGTTNIGLAGGVVLATGNVASLPGPNNSANTSANTAGFNQNSANDGDLATLTGGDQWDVVRLEFDFKPTAETVQFDYVFGSEEYCEYVGTNYNDVFGFFISGPGISGNQNIALIPATTTPVAINNVNHQTNTAYYVNNNTNNPCQAVGACCSAECALDGWTTVLTATAIGLIPCSTYHIKLAIADIADGLLFSAVFLKANSFEAGGQVKAEPVYPAGQNFVIEGCDNGFIKFIRGSGDVNVELTFNITITGTATPGLDYEQLATTFTIPAGQTEIQIPVSVYADLLAEGQETIIISLDNPCSCTQSQFTFLINDKPPLEIEMEDLELCGSSSTSLAPTLISSGQPPLTYNWNTGATSPSINITTPGTNTYTVTVTDHCGTTATASATVTLEPAPTAVLSGTGTFCAGVPGSVDLTIALTGVGPWEVVINNNGSNETQTFTSSPVTYTVNNPGNYSLVSVSTLNGCTGSATGSATLNEITVNLSAAANDPTCFNANNGSIQATATGGSGFTYSWNTGASAANLTGLGPGTYTVTATNSQGCTSEETVTLTEPPLLTATIAGSTNIDCNNPAGDADLEVGGGSPDYSYNWNNGSTVQDPTFNTGGTYSVTVTDDNNCTVTATVTITVNTTLPTAVAAPPGQITCTNTEITINGTGSSTGSQFYYAWSGPGIVCCETTLQPQVNAGGTYTLTVTNSENGCTNTVSVTVVENNTPPDVNINTPGSIGCTTPTLTLNGAGTSTGAGFTFTWSTVGGNFVCCTNTLTPQINQAGVYALAAVNNNNGCTAEASVTVSGNVDPPTATIAPPGVVDCNTPEIDLDASGSSQGGNFTYQWAAGGGGSIVGGGNTPNPTINQGGTYTITVTNTDNNCTATASVSVTASLTPPVAIATANGALTCQNPTLVLNGNGSSTGGNFTYEWTTPNGNIVSGANTLNPQVNAGGTYTLVVTNTTNGCTSSATVNVNSNVNQPQANAGPPLELNCLHPTLQLQGSGSTGAGFTVQWAANPGFILSGANTYSPTINEAGTYYLVVTNTANGCTNEDVVSVASNFDQPVASILPAGVIDCYSPQIDLDAGASTQGGNIQFSWTTPNGNIVSGSTSPYPTVNQAGTYNLVVSNTESGCTATASVTVVQNLTPPTANAGPPATLNCNIAQLTLNGSASNGSNLLIQWSTVNGNIVSGENTLNPVIDAPGAYTLLVTNWANGCTAQSTVNINADQNAPNAFAGDDNQLTCVQTSVQLSGSGSSTGAGITYQWVGNPGNIVSGASSMNPVVNAYGFYTLIVTNTSNGCTDADEVFVDDNIIYPNATILPAQQLNCTFSSVQLDAGASTQGNAIDFVWTTANGHIVSGNGTPYPEVDETGTYTLVVINTANSCTASASVTVTEDFSLPVATAVPAASITCQLPQTTLNGEGSSSGYPFFYEWTTVNGNILSGNLTLNPTVNQVGTYLLTVYNVENGCTSQASVQVITSQTFPTASAGAAQTITCAAPQSTLDGAGSSQGTPYAYVWSTQNGNIVSGANTLSPVVDAPGSYQLAVINTQTGCTAVASVEVGQNTALPQALAAPGGVLSCTATSVALDGTGSSEGAGFVYNWATSAGNIVSGQGTLHPVVSAVGVYILVVSNAANGCTASASTTVTADAGLPVANAGTADTLNCVVKQMVLNATASSQGAVYTYAWTGPGIVSGIHTLTPVVDVPGVYELLITNTSNGCTAISNVLVPADLVLPVAYAGPAAVLNCLQSVLNLNGNGSSSGPLFTYAWTASAGGNIQAGANMLTPAVNQPGTYTLQVSNIQNGCTALAAVAITQDTVHPLAGAGPPGLITCSNSIVTLSGGGSAGPAYGYLWTTANGSIASGANTLSPVVDAPGTYSLLVTDTLNGCTATSTVLVNKDANVPTAIVQAPEELTCVVQQIQLTGTGSTAGPFIQYDWTTANGNILSGATSLTPVVNAPGQYTLRVFNAANNCEALFSVNVLQNLTAPAAYAGAPAVLSCANPVLSLDGTGSSQGGQYVYLWTTVNGNIQSGAVTLTPQIDRSGNYNLLVTNTLNGCTAESSVQILLDQNSPQAEAGPSQALTCVASSVTLNGAGSSSGPGFTFTWTALNGGNLVSGANTLSPVVNAPGQYLLTVTNTNNQCTATAAVTVTQNTVEPVAVAGNPVTLTCTDPSIQLNGAGSSTGSPYSYVWTTLGGVILSGSNTLQPVIGAVGIYTLVVTDNTNGCTREASVQVLEDADAPIAVASTPGELTCNSTTLTLSGAGSSAGSNFDYLWTTSNGQILSGPSSLSPVINAPGTYQLLVTNSLNGCTETEAVNVTQNITAPQVDAGVASAITCSVTQLSLNGNASGGGQGVGYSWFTSNGNILSGSNMPTPVITSGGIYTLTVYDLYNGCSSTDQVTVPSDTQAPPIAIASPGLLTCSVLQVPIDATASAQGSAFSYAWSGLGIVSGAASLLPVVNQPGDYVLQVSNSVNGCTDTATVRVEQNTQAPQAEAGTGFELTCSVREGTLSAAGSASGLNISYLWSTSDGNIVSAATLSTPTVNAPGSYRLLVTNLLTGCTATDQALVTENTNYPDGLELTTDPPGCGGKPGVVRIDTVQGGVGPYLYSIDGGNTFLTANQFGNLSPGQYQLVVQDINGCEYEETFSFPEPLEPAVVMTPEIVLAYGESATLTALINIPLYEVDTIIWSPMERLTLTNKRNVVIARPFSTTEYTVTIVNDAGCTDRATVLVRVDDPNLWAPNAISPNNEDGENDVFLIFSGPNTLNKINSLQIYDRWGNQVFRKENIQPNDYKQGWNGRFRGQTMTPAVFVWWAEVELVSGQTILLKGDVTIVD